MSKKVMKNVQNFKFKKIYFFNQVNIFPISIFDFFQDI